MQLVCLEPNDPMRAEAENLVRSIYAATYGASLNDFPRWMVGLINASGKLSCAAGLRLSWENCFSGCYLDEPVGRILHRVTGMRISPGRILEVTTLAGSKRGDAFRLVDAIGEMGRALDMSCAIFTATARLRLALQRNGYELTPLVPARSECVADPVIWGNYYDSDPWVCALLDQNKTTDPDDLPPISLQAAVGENHAHG